VLNPWGPSDDFYLDLVMSAGSVLDVGCGTGALLHRARDTGHTGWLCGLDPDPAMLDQARARSDIEWVLADAASAAWDREFDLAVMASHAFQELVGDGELRRSSGPSAPRSATAAGSRSRPATHRRAPGRAGTPRSRRATRTATSRESPTDCGR
jgi:SAM-dependent methyltransferase